MNQCDGCRAGLPVEDGNHLVPANEGWSRIHMGCTRDLYDCPDSEEERAILENLVLLSELRSARVGLREVDHLGWLLLCQRSNRLAAVTRQLIEELDRDHDDRAGWLYRVMSY